MTQGTLDDFVEADNETPSGQESTVQTDGIRLDKYLDNYLAPNADIDADDSCPWCCAPAEDFTTELSSGDTVACGYCEARIPVDEYWYKNGEKVVL